MNATDKDDPSDSGVLVKTVKERRHAIEEEIVGHVPTTTPKAIRLEHPTIWERLRRTYEEGWDPYRFRSIRRHGCAKRFEDMTPEIERESRQLIGLGYTDIAVVRDFNPDEDGYYHFSVTGRVEVD